MSKMRTPADIILPQARASYRVNQADAGLIEPARIRGRALYHTSHDYQPPDNPHAFIGNYCLNIGCNSSRKNQQRLEPVMRLVMEALANQPSAAVPIRDDGDVRQICFPRS